MKVEVKNVPNQLRIVESCHLEGDELPGRALSDIMFTKYPNGKISLSTSNYLMTGAHNNVSKESAQLIIEWLTERVKEMEAKNEG